MGVSVGVTRHFTVNAILNPEIELTGGYSYYRFDQDRRVSMDISPEAAGVYRSKPKVSVWNASASVGNELAISDAFTLRPELGFDYASLKMKHYTESGGELALNVRPERYESFRSSLGLAVSWNPTDYLRLTGRGYWNHEFADTDVALRSRISSLDAVDFGAEGRDLGRDSGSIGAGLEWKLPLSYETRLSLDYIHTFSRTYRSNEARLSFVLNF